MFCTVYPDNSKKSRQRKFLAWQVDKLTFVNLWPAYTHLPCVIQCIYWRENWQMNWSFVLFCFSSDKEVIPSMHSIVPFTYFTSVTRLNTKCTWGSSIPCFSCKHHNLAHNLQFSSKPSNICIFISPSEFPYCAEEKNDLTLCNCN